MTFQSQSDNFFFCVESVFLFFFDVSVFDLGFHVFFVHGEGLSMFPSAFVNFFYGFDFCRWL